MDPMAAADEITAAVGAGLERFPKLTFAVLFGSAAAGRMRPDSDIDVAVYGATGGRLEIERDREIDRRPSCRSPWSERRSATWSF